MKTSLTLLILFSLASCATRAPLSYDQKCGLKGMKLTGVSESTSGGEETLQCAAPANEVQKCEVQAYADSTEPIHEWNKIHGFRYAFNGVGYLAAVVPGALLKWAFDGQQEDVLKKSSAIETEKMKACHANSDSRIPASK